MAAKVLGGVTLPGTFTISLPVDMPKQVEQVKMSDGSFRWAFFKEYRTWKLSWAKLTWTQLGVLITLWEGDAITTWVNNDESATSYNVVITDLSYNVIEPMAAIKYYEASMTLTQAI